MLGFYLFRVSSQLESRELVAFQKPSLSPWLLSMAWHGFFNRRHVKATSTTPPLLVSGTRRHVWHHAMVWRTAAIFAICPWQTEPVATSRDPSEPICLLESLDDDCCRYTGGKQHGQHGLMWLVHLFHGCRICMVFLRREEWMRNRANSFIFSARKHTLHI